MNSLSPTQRFAAAVAAQVGGLILLVVVAMPFPISISSIVVGKQFVEYATGAICLALILGIYLAYNQSKKRKDFDDSCANTTVFIFLLFDIPILLFLVCQEGGLCRSILLPVFFLIPIAHMTVECRKRAINTVLIIIIACIGIGFLVSLRVGIPRESHVNALSLWVVNIPITDFSDSASHTGYDWAVFMSAIISTLIPLWQKLVIELVTIIAKPSTSAPSAENLKEAG